MALQVLRGVSRHAARYAATRSWNTSTARALTVSTTRLAAEKAKVTHTGQVSTPFSNKYLSCMNLPNPQVWEESDYRNIRFTDKEKQVCGK